jgi:hypothetical protein
MPNTPRRLLVSIKMNLAPKPPTLAFSLIGDPAHVEWESDPVPDVDADFALGATTGHLEAPGEREEATEFLRGELAAGPQPALQVMKAAAALGISLITLKRAKKDLGIVSRREGFGKDGRWLWVLPTP